MEIVIIALLVVGALVLINLAQGLSADGEKKAPEVVNFTHSATIEGPGFYEFDIVGESHYQEALNEICGGKVKQGHFKTVTAKLFPEDENPHDPMAVCVQIEGRTVGYLSRENARKMRAQLPHAGVFWKVAAKIVGGWDDGEGSVGHYGVKLDIPLGDDDEEES